MTLKREEELATKNNEDFNCFLKIPPCWNSLTQIKLWKILKNWKIPKKWKISEKLINSEKKLHDHTEVWDF